MAKAATARTAPPHALTPTRAQQQNAALVKLGQNFAIELAPFPDGEALAAFNTDAAALVTVNGKDSHQAALELIKKGKGLKRGIDEHWMRVKRWLTDRKNDIQTIMDTDLELAEPHLKRIGQLCLTYEDLERRRIAEEERRNREEQERLARENREREVAKMEKAALDAEAGSEDLSDRERIFVQEVFLGNSPANAAFTADYKDPEKQAERLMKTPKVIQAIEGMRQAKALREQAAATEQKPIEVKTVEVQSHLGHVSGMRSKTTTWTAECHNYRAFVEAFARGERNRALDAAVGGSENGPTVDIDTFLEMTEPSETGGNAKARAMHENLDRIPGWRHIKKDTK